MLEILRKSEAEDLLKKAIKEIEITGKVSEKIVVNKKKKPASNIFLIEVGIEKEGIINKIPCNDNILRIKSNDEFLDIVNTYQKMKMKVKTA